MILNPGACDSGGSAIRAQIEGELQATCLVTDKPSPATVEEVARAVEFFLSQQGSEGIVDSRSVNLLASQALHSLGEGRAARSLVLFGTGMIRPASWEISGDRDMWVLDLREMTVRSDAVLELIIFNGLSIVLDSIADIWDETGGLGILGLRHVWSTARGLLGPADAAAARELESEIVALCTNKLQKQRTERGWANCPEVVNLDI